MDQLLERGDFGGGREARGSKNCHVSHWKEKVSVSCQPTSSIPSAVSVVGVKGDWKLEVVMEMGEFNRFKRQQVKLTRQI